MEARIKKILDDIIRYCFGENCNKLYYSYYLTIENTNRKTFHGYYEGNKHKITIFNIFRNDTGVIKTIIHELAHHIDFCNRGHSDHSAEFYEAYKRLLYTALDMGLFSKEEYSDVDKDSSDDGKVTRILEQYVPNPIEYKKDTWLISVKNSYAHKDYLKSNDYRYNGISKAWEKETFDKDGEYQKIKDLAGVEIDIREATNLKFEGTIKVTASGNTYEVKDRLKARGFRYSNKKWEFQAKSIEEAISLKREFPELLLKW